MKHHIICGLNNDYISYVASIQGAGGASMNMMTLIVSVMKIKYSVGEKNLDRTKKILQAAMESMTCWYEGRNPQGWWWMLFKISLAKRMVFSC